MSAAWSAATRAARRSNPAPMRPPACRLCGTPLSETFVDLGMSPLCESYLPADSSTQMEPFYPLHVRICARACSSSCPRTSPPRTSSRDYAYFSSYSDSWVAHAEAVRRRDDRPARARRRDSLRHRGREQRRLPAAALRRRGIPVLGVEPARERRRGGARARASRPRCAFLGARPAERSPPTARPGRPGGRATTCSRTCPTCSTSPPACGAAGADDGLVTLEFPHLLRLIEGSQYDTIYHEHYSYFSLLHRRRGPRPRTGCASSTSRSCRRTAARCACYAAHAGDRRRTRDARSRACCDEEARRAAHARRARRLRRARSRRSSATCSSSCSTRAERGPDGRRLRRARQGQHAAQPLRHPVGPVDVHGRPQPVQAGLFLPGHAHPDPPPERLAETGPTTCWSCRGTCGSEIREQLALRPRLGRPARRCPSRARGRLSQSRVNAMKVVLFCGGLGMRMRDAVDSRPSR